MEWYVLAIIAAMFAALGSITEKKTLFKEHAMEFATILTLFLFIISLPLVWIADFTMSQDYLMLIILIGIIDAVGFLYITKAVRHLEISEASPLFVFEPLVVAVLAMFFLGEILSSQQTVGMLCIIGGAYMLEFKHMKTKKAELLRPLKIIKKSKYIHYILFGLGLYAISNLLARFILNSNNPNHVDPLAFLFIVHVVIAICFIVMIHLFHDGFKGIKHGIKRAGTWIFITAIFMFLGRITLVQAFVIPTAFVALIGGIKRLSSLFSTIVGGEIYHDHNLKMKITACIIMVLGAILIVV